MFFAFWKEGRRIIKKTIFFIELCLIAGNEEI